MANLKMFQSFAPQKDEKLHGGINTVIYTRVSHHSQEENTSLESQKKSNIYVGRRKHMTSPQAQMSAKLYYHGRLLHPRRRNTKGMVDTNPKEYRTRRDLSKNSDI